MRLVPIVVLLTLAVISDAAVLSGGVNGRTLHYYDLRISVLHDILAEECPMYSKYQKQRRTLAEEDFQKHMVGSRIVYVKMVEDLEKCRKMKLHVSSTTPTTATTPTTTTIPITTTPPMTPALPCMTTTQTTTAIPPILTIPTATTPPATPALPCRTTTPTTTAIPPILTVPTTTTPPVTPTLPCRAITPTTTTTPTPTTTPATTTPAKPPQPAECLTATNFTDSWRLDHNGSDYKPGGAHSHNGYACDFSVDTQWFRFTGAAGNRMLNTCPKHKSCGTEFSTWTDEEMPKSVGVKTTISVYGVSETDCLDWFAEVQVMRCSTDTDHDLIYRVVDPDTDLGYTCSDAFCGMN